MKSSNATPRGLILGTDILCVILNDFIPAFHPKAPDVLNCNWQVFWLVLCWAPSHPAKGG
jgi:hypothetical protein